MKNTETMSTELQQAHNKLQVYLQKHWQLFLFEGVVFILLGMAAIIVPQFFSLVIVIFLGWIIILAGTVHASRALFFRDAPGFGLWLGLGVLQLLVGYLLIANPMTGVITLTMMMALFFAFEGLIKIYLALMMRSMPQWRFMLISGITALFFAAIILIFWSETAHWLLGLFLGINMVMLGWSLVKMSLEHKTND